MIFVCLGILLCILLYAVFYPRTNTIYKDKYGAQVLVIKIVKTCVIVQYVDYDEKEDRVYAISGPQNIDLWEFMWSHRLWIVL